MENDKCSKCGGEIEEGGFVYAGPYGAIANIFYANNINRGIFVSKLVGKKNVIVKRCTSCGYIEIYTK